MDNERLAMILVAVFLCFALYLVGEGCSRSHNKDLATAHQCKEAVGIMNIRSGNEVICHPLATIEIEENDGKLQVTCRCPKEETKAPVKKEVIGKSSE